MVEGVTLVTEDNPSVKPTVCHLPFQGRQKALQRRFLFGKVFEILITLNNRETESICFRFSVCVHFMVNVFGVTHLICRISSAVRKLFFAEFKKLFPSVVYFFLELLYKMFVAFLEKMFKSSLWLKEIFDRFFILWFIVKYPFTVDNLE